MQQYTGCGFGRHKYLKKVILPSLTQARSETIEVYNFQFRSCLFSHYIRSKRNRTLCLAKLPRRQSDYKHTVSYCSTLDLHRIQVLVELFEGQSLRLQKSCHYWLSFYLLLCLHWLLLSSLYGRRSFPFKSAFSSPFAASYFLQIKHLSLLGVKKFMLYSVQNIFL